MFLALALLVLNDRERVFFDKLYDKFNSAMYRYALGFMGSKDDAEDLMQDAIIKLIVNVESLMELPEEHLLNYIKTTIQTTALNNFRHKEVVKKYFSDKEFSEYSPDILNMSMSAEAMFMLKETSRELLNAFLALKPMEQLVLSGKYHLDLNDDELAKLFGCKPASIRTKLSRARKHWIENFKKEENCCG